MSLFDRFEHYVNVLGPPSESTDTGGGVVIAWPTTRASNVPCLINSGMNATQSRFGSDNLISSDTIAFNGDVTIARGDLLVAVGGPYTGGRWRVTGLNAIQGMGNIGSFLMAQVEEVL